MPVPTGCWFCMDVNVLSGMTPANLSVTDFSRFPDPQISLSGDTGLVGDSTGPSVASGPPDAVSGPLADSGPLGDSSGPSADNGPPGAPRPATGAGRPADRASLATDGPTGAFAPPGSRFATGDDAEGSGAAGAGASPSSASAKPAAATDIAPDATATTTALHHIVSKTKRPSADVLTEPGGQTPPGICRRTGVVAGTAVVEKGMVCTGLDDDFVHQPCPL